MLNHLASLDRPTRRPLDLVPEQVRAMTAAQELHLLQQAYASRPDRTIRRRLARLLVFEEQLEELHELLANATDLDASEALMLADCCLLFERPDMDREAARVAQGIVDVNHDPKVRSAGLAYLGKALIRQDDLARARTVLQQALELNPANFDACKRLAFVYMKTDDDQGFADAADLLARKGARHCRLWAAQMLSLARSGRIAEARELWGFDRFAQQAAIAPPGGWDSIEAFNRDLAEELLTHPGMRFDRTGSASNQTWRVEHPLRNDRPAIRALADLLVARIVARCEELGTQDHPWIEARPDRAFLRMWSVITDSAGFESWHVHQFGWMSGVYYVQIPQSIAAGNSDSGCLKFGLPDDLAGNATAAAFGHKVVRPREGAMHTFPSHSYHRTFPHATGEKRICVAFDVRPID